MIPSKVSGNCSVNSISIFTTTTTFAIPAINFSNTTVSSRRSVRMKVRMFNKQYSSVPEVTGKPSVVHDSLRVLEWDKLCDSVASFAGTSLGKEATKAQLRRLDQTYEESMKLLEETNAAVEMHKFGSLDFSGINVVLVKSAVQHAQKYFPVGGSEALAVVALLQFAEALQFNVRAAMKEDAKFFHRSMPLAETIMEFVISRSLVKFIQQLIDEDGSVKDSASSTLRQSRDKVRLLEKKLYQLMDSLVRNQMTDASFLEVNNIDGRWCIRTGTDLPTSFEGLLLSSGSGAGSILEPLSAVPLNDELQQARALVVKAESDVLLKITEKMRADLDDIENLLNKMIQLDVINARATYSLSFGGTNPDLYLPESRDGCAAPESSTGEKASFASQPLVRKWTLYMPKSYHPLLLQQRRQNLQKAMKDVSNATAEIRRRKLQGGNLSQKDDLINLSALKEEVVKLEQALPVPVDIFISENTRVLVMTGPNTGGKTICLKTVGLAAMMAKSGLHVLSSEPVKIPWFDSVFADIGDEQSLSQSLSTFSAHLKHISEILEHSTSQSLVLLDEVGAGTNPLEGAALGMSVLESFAETGALLTIATTHHGELKTLKYSNDAFENACLEFDEVNLKPTYRILWGVPGRSNAINIAKRLGLPNQILEPACELYGTASQEINELIIDMERFKQSLRGDIHEAQHYLAISRELHRKILVTRRKVSEHGTMQRYRMMQQLSELAAMARSILHKKLRQLRASATQSSQPTTVNKIQLTPTSNSPTVNSQIEIANISEPPTATGTVGGSIRDFRGSSSEKRPKLPKVGGTVQISTLNTKGTVLKVEPSKEEIIVQVGKMKMKLKLRDVVI